MPDYLVRLTVLSRASIYVLTKSHRTTMVIFGHIKFSKDVHKHNNTPIFIMCI